MIDKKFICDQCMKVKGEANRWYKIRIGEAFHIYAFETDIAESVDDESIEVRHVCGQECALKIQQREFFDRHSKIQPSAQGA